VNTLCSTLAIQPINALFFSAPLKWVVGSVARSVGCVVGRKNTAPEPRKISALAFERRDFFRGEDYGIGYFA